MNQYVIHYKDGSYEPCTAESIFDNVGCIAFRNRVTQGHWVTVKVVSVHNYKSISLVGNPFARERRPRARTPRW